MNWEAVGQGTGEWNVEEPSERGPRIIASGLTEKEARLIAAAPKLIDLVANVCAEQDKGPSDEFDSAFDSLFMFHASLL